MQGLGENVTIESVADYFKQIGIIKVLVEQSVTCQSCRLLDFIYTVKISL